VVAVGVRWLAAVGKTSKGKKPQGRKLLQKKKSSFLEGCIGSGNGDRVSNSEEVRKVKRGFSRGI
jgi:hypothetical protein